MAENAAATRARPRPLSPHLQIYRWTPTMLTSIVHRITGVGLSAGLAGLAWFLMALASGPDAYDTFCMVAFSIPGLVVLFGFTWALTYHLFNGIRHLTWDIGYGFRPKTANGVSLFIIVASVLVAAALFGFGLMKSGAF